MPDSLDPVLLNVRRAYRLLNAYHQRLLSMIPKIAEFFQKEFQAWEAGEHYRGNKANKEVFNSHLGLMPLQQASFLFRPMGKLPLPGEWLLDVVHVGDTASYLEDDYDYDPASLPEAEKAATEIRLFAFLVREGGSGDWYGLWNGSRYPGDEPEHDLEIAGEKVWQGTSTECLVWAFGRTWSVADFANEALFSDRCKEFHNLVARIAATAPTR